MKKFNKSILKVSFVFLLGIFITRCYTIVHPPFTVKERVTVIKQKVIEENESDEDYEDEEYYDEEEVDKETHIYYHHYYEPFNDLYYYSRLHPLWHRHYPHFYFDFGFGMGYSFHRFPWVSGLYYYEPLYYPYNPYCFGWPAYRDYYPWNMRNYPFAYGGYYGHRSYPGYGYYDDYRSLKPYKKRDFGRRQDYRTTIANNRIMRSAESIEKSGGNNQAKKTSDSYKGRRTKREEYTKTKSIKKSTNTDKKSSTRTERSTGIKKSTKSDSKSSATRTKSAGKSSNSKPKSSVATGKGKSGRSVTKGSSGSRRSSRPSGTSTRASSGRSFRPSGTSTRGSSGRSSKPSGSSGGRRERK